MNSYYWFSRYVEGEQICEDRSISMKVDPLYEFVFISLKPSKVRGCVCRIIFVKGINCRRIGSLIDPDGFTRPREATSSYFPIEAFLKGLEIPLYLTPADLFYFVVFRLSLVFVAFRKYCRSWYNFRECIQRRRLPENRIIILLLSVNFVLTNKILSNMYSYIFVVVYWFFILEAFFYFRCCLFSAFYSMAIRRDAKDNNNKSNWV